MLVKVLGCGTSTGVPVPGCICTICHSSNEKNKRLRTSALISFQRKDFSLPDHAGSHEPEREDPEESLFNILLDTGPDLRTQLLRENINQVHAVLYTHTHADHIFGIDDLRGICFAQGHSVMGFGSHDTVEQMKHFFPYIFSPDPNYMGGAPPAVELEAIEPYKPFRIPLQNSSVTVLPLPILHGEKEILGYRIGSFAYLTDCSKVPEATREHLLDLDLLFLSGLRPRPHPTHFSIPQAVEEILRVKPRKAFLIHLSHDADYEIEEAALQDRAHRGEFGETEIHLAYDGLSISQ